RPQLEATGGRQRSNKQRRRPSAFLMRNLIAWLAAASLASGLLVIGPAGHPQTAQAAAVPGTSCNVLPANNVSNTDISTLPVNSHSAAWLSSTGATAGR